MYKCCICGKEHEGFGNNPDGACWKDEHGNIVVGKFNKEDRCCDDCNLTYVLSGRLYMMSNRENYLRTK